MRYILIIFFSGFLSLVQAGTFSQDSIGLEEVNGQKFILHKVEMSETLYSVSRKYNVSIYKIIESNPPTEFGLEVGQVIKIPYEKEENKPEKKQINKEEQKEVQVINKDITHRVVQKETLYAISRAYEVSIEDIKKWNDLQGNSIDIGQELVIKQTQEVSSAKEEGMISENTNENNKTHIVKPKETMYSLSKQYDVSIEDILEWNGMTSTDIGIGQELIVGKEAIETSSKDITIRVTTVKKSPNAIDSLKEDSSAKQKAKIDSSAFQHEEKNRMESPVKENTEFEEIIESGTAALIEGSEGNRKYLALHRTAKVGTILRVKNEMNDQEVFVRVLGKLPDTGINKNVVIRISKSAYDRLGAIDPKFRVTISYIP